MPDQDDATSQLGATKIETALRDIARDKRPDPSLRLRYHVLVPPPSGGGEITITLESGELHEVTSIAKQRRRKLSRAQHLSIIQLLIEIEAWQTRPMTGPPTPDSWNEQLSIQIGDAAITISEIGDPAQRVRRVYEAMTRLL